MLAATEAVVKAPFIQSDVTELNRCCLVFDKLTNEQARQAHWSLVDAYVSVIT